MHLKQIPTYGLHTVFFLSLPIFMKQILLKAKKHLFHKVTIKYLDYTKTNCLIFPLAVLYPIMSTWVQHEQSLD